MNFYKERDEDNQLVVNKLYPNLQRNENESNEERYFVPYSNCNKNCNLSSQIKKTPFARNIPPNQPISIPSKQIKHNLPVGFLPERNPDTQLQNTITRSHDIISPAKLPRGSMSRDDVIKNKDNCDIVKNPRLDKSCKNDHNEFIKGHERTNQNSNNKLQKNIHQIEKPINVENEDNIKSNKQQNVCVDLESCPDEHLKIDEDTLGTILQLCVENQNLIVESYVSVMADKEKYFKGSENSIPKVSKIVSDILKIVANTVSDAVNETLNQEYIQKGHQRKNGHKNQQTTSSPCDNLQTRSDSGGNNLTLNQQKLQNYSGFYQYQRPQPQPADEACHDGDNSLNSSSILKFSLQKSQYAKQNCNLNDHRKSQLNFTNTAETMRFEDYPTQTGFTGNKRLIPDNVQQHNKTLNDSYKTVNNENNNHNIMLLYPGEDSDDNDKEYSNEYLRQKMINDMRSKKRKLVGTTCGHTDCVIDPKSMKYNTPIPELPKRPRYEKVPHSDITPNESVNMKKNIAGSILNEENIADCKSDESIVTVDENKNSDKVEEKDNSVIECVDLDDDEENDSYKAIQAISQMNKKLLLKKITKLKDQNKEKDNEKEEVTKKFGYFTKLIDCIFKRLMDKLEGIDVMKPQLHSRFDQCAPTKFPNEIQTKSTKPNTQLPTDNAADVKKPTSYVNCDEMQDVNHFQPQLNPEVSPQPDYEAFKQYQRAMHQNQAYVTQRGEVQISKMDNPFHLPLDVQQNPRFNRPPAPVTAENLGLCGVNRRINSISQRPQMPQKPQKPLKPQKPHKPRKLQKPQMPQIPQRPQMPQIPQRPQMPQIPQMQQIPQRPQMPQIPQRPLMPQIPQRPQMPQIPQRPQMLQIQQRPQTPHMPQEPQMPYQYNFMDENWYYGQNNDQPTNNVRQNIEFQQYQNQMGQRHVTEQQRYYHMLSQNNAWAPQTGNYPENNWP